MLLLYSVKIILRMQDIHNFPKTFIIFVIIKNFFLNAISALCKKILDIKFFRV